MIAIDIDNIPDWIQDTSPVWKIWKENNDNKDNNDDNDIVIDEKLIKYKVNNIGDFENMLAIVNFWDLEDYPQSFWTYGYKNKQEVSEFLLNYINSERNYKGYKIILEKILSNVSNIEDLENFLIVFRNNTDLETNGNIVSFVIKESKINYEEIKNLLSEYNQAKLIKLISQIKISLDSRMCEYNYLEFEIGFHLYNVSEFILIFTLNVVSFNYLELINFINNIETENQKYIEFYFTDDDFWSYEDNQIQIRNDEDTNIYIILVNDDNRSIICKQLKDVANEILKEVKRHTGIDLTNL